MSQTQFMKDQGRGFVLLDIDSALQHDYGNAARSMAFCLNSDGLLYCFTSQHRTYIFHIMTRPNHIRARTPFLMSPKLAVVIKMACNKSVLRRSFVSREHSSCEVTCSV